MTPQGDWKLALAVCLIVAGTAPFSHADAPDWADDAMLVVYPEALWVSPPPQETTRAESPAGRTRVSDAGVQSVDSAAWWESAADSEQPTPSPIRPTSVETVLPVQHTRAAYGPPVGEGWQVLPAGVLYKSYIAGEKEPRMGVMWLNEKDRGAVLESTIGGRLGFLRYGNPGPINPQGFQWDLEGAALLRQDPEQELDVESTDFRVGTVLTWRQGPTAAKFGYYHLSSHLGDEFVLRNTTFPRLNYVRDSILLGVHHYVRPDVAVYGEVAYALKTDGGAEPLELQFGVEYVPLDATSRVGAPVLAVNGHLRQEFNFGGSVNVIAGWEWRGPTSNRRLRVGGQYYNGKEIQWAFFDESVTYTGLGLWYDF